MFLCLLSDALTVVGWSFGYHTRPESLHGMRLTVCCEYASLSSSFEGFVLPAQVHVSGAAAHRARFFYGELSPVSL